MEHISLKKFSRRFGIKENLLCWGIYVENEKAFPVVLISGTNAFIDVHDNKMVLGKAAEFLYQAKLKEEEQSCSLVSLNGKLECPLPQN